VPSAEHGPIMDVQAMARAASSTADEEGHTEEAAVMKSSTAVPGAPFGDFTPDEEKRFLASADGDKVEAMRRYKAALVRGAGMKTVSDCFVLQLGSFVL